MVNHCCALGVESIGNMLGSYLKEIDSLFGISDHVLIKFEGLKSICQFFGFLRVSFKLMKFGNCFGSELNDDTLKEIFFTKKFPSFGSWIFCICFILF